MRTNATLSPEEVTSGGGVSKRQLNLAAPALLSAAEFAVRELRAGPVTTERVGLIIDRLQSAIAKADSDEGWQFKFTVTPQTWDAIQVMLRKRDDKSKLHDSLKRLLMKGYRKTVRRVYCDVDVDVNALARFQTLLASYDPPGATSRAFDRLIDQMNDQIFNRPALEILAETGL